MKTIESKVITWDEFENTYGPQQSGREEFNGWLYETYGDDEKYIRKFNEENPNRVWTILDCGHMVISSGWHFVNRFGYIITDKPFGVDEDITVEDQEDKEHEAALALTVEELSTLEGGSKDYLKLLAIFFSIYEDEADGDEAVGHHLINYDVAIEIDKDDTVIKVEKPKTVLATIIRDFYENKPAMEKALGMKSKLVIKYAEK